MFAAIKTSTSLFPLFPSTFKPTAMLMHSLLELVPSVTLSHAHLSTQLPDVASAFPTPPSLAISSTLSTHRPFFPNFNNTLFSPDSGLLPIRLTGHSLCQCVSSNPLAPTSTLNGFIVYCLQERCFIIAILTKVPCVLSAENSTIIITLSSVIIRVVFL